MQYSEFGCAQSFLGNVCGNSSYTCTEGVYGHVYRNTYFLHMYRRCVCRNFHLATHDFLFNSAAFLFLQEADGPPDPAVVVTVPEATAVAGEGPVLLPAICRDALAARGQEEICR